MYCAYCGKSLSDGVEFCSICGAKQSAVSDGDKGIYRHELTRLRPQTEAKNPKAAGALGFFLSWIFLGPVGYIYLGQWNWFWLTFIIQIFAYPLTAFFAYPLLPIVYGIHQYQMARDLNAIRREGAAGGAAAEAGSGDAKLD